MSFPPSVAWLLAEEVYPEEGEAIETLGQSTATNSVGMTVAAAR
jgi:hypothetical protein